MKKIDVDVVWIVIQFFHFKTLYLDENCHTESNENEADDVWCQSGDAFYFNFFEH